MHNLEEETKSDELMSEMLTLTALMLMKNYNKPALPHCFIYQVMRVLSASGILSSPQSRVPPTVTLTPPPACPRPVVMVLLKHKHVLIVMQNVITVSVSKRVIFPNIAPKSTQI